MAETSQEEEVELGEEETGTSIGRKYEQQMRELVTQRLDIPVLSLGEMIDAKRLDLQPDFQRRSRWNDQQRSRLIESIIMNVPIPPVFLGEDKYGKYVVLDGRQRLTAIDGFMRGHYALEGLDVWDELNHKRFAGLGSVRDYITRRFIPAVVILRESSKEIKYDVFDRLNTGGVVLAPMELRNALFRGPFTETIRELSEHPIFLKLWGIPAEMKARENNLTYQKMTDMELVLRFFALQTYQTFTDRTKLKGFLSDYMQGRNEAYEEDATLKKHDVAAFDRAVNCTWIVFREAGFRKPKAKKLSVRSAPLADAVMFAFRHVDPASLTDSVSTAIKNAFSKLFETDTAFVASVSEGTNGRAAVVTRLETMENLVKAHVPLLPTRRFKLKVPKKSSRG
jgi:hypothetical protein